MADRDIPEEMVADVAQAIHDVWCQCGGSAADSDKSMEAARAVLSAALAGRTVVELPEPTATGDYDSGYSSVWVNGANRVASAFGSLQPENAESYALALLAAAREARSRAAGSGVGDQDGA